MSNLPSNFFASGPGSLGGPGGRGKAGRITYCRPAVPACRPEISHRARYRSPPHQPESPWTCSFSRPCHRLKQVSSFRIPSAWTGRSKMTKVVIMLDHVFVTVRDLDRSIAFYEKAL